MKSRPKALRFAAAAAAAVLLASCSSGTSDPSTGAGTDGPYAPPAADVTAEITISNWGDPNDKAIYDSVVARFEEKYPNVTVNNDFTPITTWTEYVSKLVAAVASGNAPDVINIATEGVELGLYNDLFAPMDSYIANDPEAQPLLDAMNPTLVDGFTKDGSTYLVPNTWNSMLIYYNTQMFADAGIERPADDWTWDDFLAIANQLTTGDGASKVYGFGLPYFNFGIMPWLYTSSTSTMSEDLKTPTMTDPATVEAVEWVRDLVTEEGVAPQPKGADPYQLFPAGKVAMTGAGHWLVSSFADAGFSDYDVLPWPQNTESSTVWGGGGFAISQDSENKDLAWELIKALADEETQMQWAAAGAAVPSMESAAISPDFTEFPEHASLYFTSIENARPVPAPTVFSTLEPSFMRAMDSIMAGGDAATELAKANDEVQQALEDE
ncbi:sugar ABC transporter substrate-binding protein [Actinotalea sp. K2]|uniref:ABC transporter substrate-binding protein n=1 Tax=Actinotalea sp. K2 TaxID=2939438 RepID=UPI002016EF65|nr:sugar ABC transporter substrate-binding protein [Actinotalea sp. K2]MCL3859808.1 sugar ABC transporter substrate-binding protein [Actinotalea sp. K2]